MKITFLNDLFFDLQMLEISDREGRLYCLNDFVNTSCWLKMVPLAKDCQSPNVMLMNAEKGVVLKTIKNIYPGEPLLMWFTENILAMMNIPFLTPRNILGTFQKDSKYFLKIYIQ